MGATAVRRRCPSCRPRTRRWRGSSSGCKWSVLCEQPLRYVERRYAEMWAELSRTDHRHQGGRRRMIETTANGQRSAPATFRRTTSTRRRSVLGRRAARRPPSARARRSTSACARITSIASSTGSCSRRWCRLHGSDRKIDHLTVAEALRERGQLEAVGGAEAIEELAGWVPAAGHAREYGRIVRENAQLRGAAARDLRDPGPDRRAPASW